jgi:hypothetical protein
MDARDTRTLVMCWFVALTLAPLAPADQWHTRPRSLILTGWDAAAVERARAGALRRLEKSGCRALLADFTDGQGWTIDRRLADVGMGPAEYVRTIPFIDGSSQPVCRGGKVALAATPGVARVHVCPTFADFQLRQPRLAESLVIHEMLHTLGLGENPPSSREITHRVEARCP